MEIILVDKRNYHLMLDKFKKLINDEKCKYTFMNMEVSNLQNINSKTFNENGDIIKEKYDYIIKTLTENFSQIIFTEITLSTNEYSIINTFIIPSLKIHKYKEESFVKFQPECIRFLESLGKIENYQFCKITDFNSLSYLNMKDEITIKENYEKILSEGKPSKKENKKSYNYFPKNVYNPRHSVKELILDISEKIYNFIIDENNIENIARYEIKDEYYIAERIINFDWKNLIVPYDKNMIKCRIISYEIEKKGKAEIKSFINFLRKVYNLIVLKFNKDIEFESFDTVITNNWKNFLENYFNFSFIINNQNSNWNILKLNDIDEIKIDHISLFVKKLISYLDNDTKTLSFESFKDIEYYDISNLIPAKSKYTFKYQLEIIVDRQLLKQKMYIKDFKKNYDHIFMNKNNEKKILYDYEIEKNLTKFFEEFNKNIQINNQPGYNFTIRITDHLFFNDLNYFITTMKNEFINIFENSIDFSIESNLMKDKSNNINYTRNIIICKIKKSLPDIDFRERLSEFIIAQKKLLNLSEEFGISNFFKILIDSNKTIICNNIFLKSIILFKDIFEKNLNFEKFEKFLFNTISPRALDLNNIITVPFMKEFMLYKNDYITHRILKIFMKYNTNSYDRRIGIIINNNKYFYSLNGLTKVSKKIQTDISQLSNKLSEIQSNYKVIFYNSARLY